jgi:DNA-binding GntR family transcriptional regulator
MTDPTPQAFDPELDGGESPSSRSAVAAASGSADPALVDDLADRIHSRILVGDFPVGSWLRQEALASMFGVSRTPIREALRKLQADRVVELLPHRGALVRGPSAVDIRESYLIRGELEGLAAELAAARITDEGLLRLRAAEDAFRQALPELETLVRDSGVEAVGSGPWDAANLAFHDAILDAAGIGRLNKLVADLRRTFPRSISWAALSEEASLLEENISQHTRIRAAIERGDSPAARRWMVDHCRRTGDLVATWFETRFQGAPVGGGPGDA